MRLGSGASARRRIAPAPKAAAKATKAAQREPEPAQASGGHPPGLRDALVVVLFK